MSEALSNHEVRVAYFVRSLPHLLVSAWQQGVKWGEDLSFVDWVEDASSTANRPALVAPKDFLDEVVASVGRESLVLFDADGHRQEGMDPLASVLHSAFGVAPHLERTRSRNFSPGLSVSVLQRQINAVIGDIEPQISWKIFGRSFMRQMRRRDSERLGELIDAGIEQIEGGEMRELDQRKIRARLDQHKRMVDEFSDLFSGPRSVEGATNYAMPVFPANVARTELVHEIAMEFIREGVTA